MRFLPKRVEFQTPLGVNLVSIFVVATLAGVSVLFTAFAVYLLAIGYWGFPMLAVAATGCFISALTGHVARDLHGKWGTRVVMDDPMLTLDLPSGRSLIHRPPTQHLRIPYADIEAIETRLEAYGSLGMGIMQRAYVLHRKNGELIFLFEDRALGTGLASDMFSKLAADIAERAHVPLRDLGMVEGRGGVLAVWGTHAPDWAAPSLPLAQQFRLWRHAAFTGTLAFSVVIIAVVLRFLIAVS
jgi:hypothetical protein